MMEFHPIATWIAVGVALVACGLMAIIVPLFSVFPAPPGPRLPGSYLLIVTGVTLFGGLLMYLALSSTFCHFTEEGA